MKKGFETVNRDRLRSKISKEHICCDICGQPLDPLGPSEYWRTHGKREVYVRWEVPRGGVTQMSYELVIMSPEGYRWGHAFTKSLSEARQKAANILEDYPCCIFRIYSYRSLTADPVLVEAIE